MCEMSAPQASGAPKPTPYAARRNGGPSVRTKVRCYPRMMLPTIPTTMRMRPAPMTSHCALVLTLATPSTVKGRSP